MGLPYSFIFLDQSASIPKRLGPVRLVLSSGRTTRMRICPLRDQATWQWVVVGCGRVIDMNDFYRLQSSWVNESLYKFIAWMPKISMYCTASKRASLIKLNGKKLSVKKQGAILTSMMLQTCWWFDKRIGSLLWIWSKSSPSPRPLQHVIYCLQKSCDLQVRSCSKNAQWNEIQPDDRCQFMIAHSPVPSII